MASPYAVIQEKVTNEANHGDLDQDTRRILRRMASEPALRRVLYEILVFCETMKPLSAVEREILSFPEMKSALQTPQTIVSWLVQVGGIQQVAAKGNESIWLTTPAGRKVTQVEAPADRMARLLAQEPRYRAVYFRVLQACKAPKTRFDLEAMLDAEPVLESPKVYASYFIEALERAGGLEWSGRWRTTQAGKEITGESGAPDADAAASRS